MAVQAPIRNLLAIFEAHIRKDDDDDDGKEQMGLIVHNKSRSSDDNGGDDDDDDDKKGYALVKDTVKSIEGRCTSMNTSAAITMKPVQESTVKKQKKVFDRVSSTSKSIHRRSSMGPVVAAVMAKYGTSDDDNRPVFVVEKKKKRKHREKKNQPPPSTESTATATTKTLLGANGSVEKPQKSSNRRCRRSSVGPGVAMVLAKYDTSADNNTQMINDDDDVKHILVAQQTEHKVKRRQLSTTKATRTMEQMDQGVATSVKPKKRVSRSKIRAMMMKKQDDAIAQESKPSKTIGKVQIPETLIPRSSTSTGNETSKRTKKKKHNKKETDNKNLKKIHKQDDNKTDTPSSTTLRKPGKLQVPRYFSQNKFSSKSKSVTRSAKKQRIKAQTRKRFAIPDFKDSRESHDLRNRIPELLRILADPVQDSIDEVLDILALQCQKDLPKPSPVTNARRFARRASTGRLYGSDRSLDVPSNATRWECKIAHAIRISNIDASVKESGVSPLSRRTPRRRHSIGSVAVCPGTDESQDFWHTYEALDETSDTAPRQPMRSNETGLDDDYERPKNPMEFARRRTVMFDNNVTVWFFTKENPMEHDLRLPQAFIPAVTTQTDAAPKMARRRSSSDESSMKQDQATLLRELSGDVRNDFIPVIPKRNTYDSDDSDETITYYDDDETSVASIVSAPMEERPRRVCFAEERNEVVYVEKYIKEMEIEVVLPQAGVIFCACEASSDVPTAPRRRSEKAVEAVANIRTSIRGLNESEAEHREARETDLLPRRPVRRDSLSSMGSWTSSVRRARSMELPLRSRRTLLILSTQKDTPTISEEISSSILGREIVLDRTQPAKIAKDVVCSSGLVEEPKEIKWGGCDHKNTWGGSDHKNTSESETDGNGIVLDVFDVNGVFPTRRKQKRTLVEKTDALFAKDFDPHKPPSSCIQAIQEPNLCQFSALSYRPTGWRGYSFKQSPSLNSSPANSMNQSPNSLRPGTWRGESVKSLDTGVRTDSTRSFTTEGLIDEDEPSSFTYPSPSSIRPRSMRGNSIRSRLSYRMDSTRNFGMDDAIDEDVESSHGMSSVSCTRPGTMRGNSIRNGFRMDSNRSFTTDDLIYVEEEEDDAPSSSQAGRFSAFAMRPGGFRGNSIRSMSSHRADSTRSFTTDDIVQERREASLPFPGERFSAFAMRPGTFRGDSFRN